MIFTTEEHMFLTSTGWKPASGLKVDDKLVTYDESDSFIKAVNVVDTTSVAVYNFEVETVHTYCITGENIVVHNSCKLE